MLSKVYTAALSGIESGFVTVETDISRGIPCFNTVGLPSATIREARERIRSAIINSGYEFPAKRITINLSPASTRKEGSHFDLPMAMGILISAEVVRQQRVLETGFIGELSLDGRLIPVAGALPLVLGMKEKGLKRVVVPDKNAAEASLVEGIAIVPARSLKEVVAYINDRAGKEGAQEIRRTTECNIYNRRKVTGYDVDFADVAGQEAAKRAITIAVAGGGHGIYMTGSPGSGKTMLARRIPTVMPPLSYKEILEITKIYSVSKLLTEEQPLVDIRPFRMPYHSVTETALLGGGRIPRPGEVSLAHKGVLFLDEFPEFERSTIDLLRQVLETGEVSIDRIEGRAVYPASFMFVAAGNPCKCGYYGDSEKECTCSDSEIRNYRRKISGPVLDRIDIHIRVEKAKIDELCGGNGGIENPDTAARTSSADMRRDIDAALDRQRHRYREAEDGIITNALLRAADIQKYCRLDSAGRLLIGEAYRKLGLSARGYEKVLKIARTIADIEGTESIKDYHIAEALQYRVASAQ